MNQYRLKSLSGELPKTTGVREEQVAQAAILSKPLNWIQPQNLEYLLELRQHDVMDSVRSLYRTNAKALQRATPTDVEAAVSGVTEKIESQIRLELQEEAKRGQELFSGPAKKVIQATGIVGLSLAGSAIPLLAPAAFAQSMVGGPSPFDALKAVVEKPTYRPIGHLVALYKENKFVDVITD